MIYNETSTEIYIGKEERIRPENSNNHNTDRPDMYLDKRKQEIKRKKLRGTRGKKDRISEK